MSNDYDVYNTIEKFYNEFLNSVKENFPDFSEKDQILIARYLLTKIVQKLFNF